MKVKDYYLARGEEGQERLEAWQKEADEQAQSLVNLEYEEWLDKYIIKEGEHYAD